MKTLNVMLSNLGGRVVPIGYEGENLYTRIRINCIEVFSEYPDATVSMVVSPPDGAMYPAVVEKSGVMVVWDITDSVLSSNGSGECQLTFTEGDVVRKSVVFGISINRSLIASGEAPEPVQEWIDRAEQTAQEIAENAAMLAKQDIVESYGSIAPAIIETASGEIASFSDGADGMLVKKMTVDIDPVQDLHGQEAPYPAGGGKNLFPLPTVAETKNGVTVEATSSGELWVHGTPTIVSGYLSFDMPPVSQSIIGQTATISIHEKIEGIGVAGGASGGGLNISMSDTVTSRTALYSSVANVPAINVRYDVGAIDKKFKIQLEIGSSVTAWTPYSNVCPISGWNSANVSRTGKNLFDASKVTSGYWLSGKWNTNDWWCGILIPCEPGRKISVSGNPTVGGVNGVWLNQFIDPTTGYISSFSYAGVTTFTAPTGAYGFWLPLYKSNDWSALQIEYGSSVTAYEAFNGTTAEYEFPQAAKPVYGGTLTIHQDGSGELVVASKKIMMGSLSWIREETSSLFYIFSTGNVEDRAANTNFITSVFPNKNHYRSDLADNEIGVYNTTNGIKRFAVRADSCTTSESFNEAFSGQSIVYELATPVTYQLTNQQVIALLKGSNNIWADTGDVAVEYPADTKLYIDGKVAELQALILENISNS